MKQGKSTYANVYATFEVSAKHLAESKDQVNIDALELPHILAFMHSGVTETIFRRASGYGQTLPVEMFPDDTELNYLTEHHVARLPGYIRNGRRESFDSTRWRQACSVLASFSIIIIGESEDSIVLSMHPLAYAWALLRQNMDKQTSSWIMAMSTLVLSAESKRKYNPFYCVLISMMVLLAMIYMKDEFRR